MAEPRSSQDGRSPSSSETALSDNTLEQTQSPSPEALRESFTPSFEEYLADNEAALEIIDLSSSGGSQDSVS